MKVGGSMYHGITNHIRDLFSDMMNEDELGINDETWSQTYDVLWFRVEDIINQLAYQTLWSWENR